MREWITTGEVTMPDEDGDTEPSDKPGFVPRTVETNPVKAARAGDDRPTIKIAKDVKISQTDMDIFKEMGGTMKRGQARAPIVFTEAPDPLP